MAKKHQLLLGAHMSIAGNVGYAIERGESIGCTAIQIFTKSNRQWHAKKISEDEATFFKEQWKQSNIQSIIAHASYLINIGSPEKHVEHKSVDALKIEMQRCELLDIPYLVLHPGSATDKNLEACLERISKNADAVFEAVPGHTGMLLEIMAGQGTGVGSTFEQLELIIKNSTPKRRLGVCIDTCHLFAAGYDLRTEKTYEAVWEQFDKVIGLHRLKAMHINDSKTDLGSRVDRHTHIGKGKLGLDAFKFIFNDPRFFDIPKVLETPKGADLKEDVKNMETIYELLSKKTREKLNCEF